MTINQKMVLAQIAGRARGETSAIDSKTLQGLTGLSDVKVRKAVHDLRRLKYSIGSGAQGFFMSESPEEIRRTVAQLKSRGFSILKTAAILEGTPAAEMAGQLRLALEGGENCER